MIIYMIIYIYLYIYDYMYTNTIPNWGNYYSSPSPNLPVEWTGFGRHDSPLVFTTSEIPSTSTNDGDAGHFPLSI